MIRFELTLMISDFCGRAYFFMKPDLEILEYTRCIALKRRYKSPWGKGSGEYCNFLEQSFDIYTIGNKVSGLF